MLLIDQLIVRPPAEEKERYQTYQCQGPLKIAGKKTSRRRAGSKKIKKPRSRPFTAQKRMNAGLQEKQGHSGDNPRKF